MLLVTYEKNMTCLKNKFVFYRKILLFFLLSFSYTSAWALTYDVEGMLLTLQQSLPELFNLAVGGAYVMGIAFVFKGIYELKMYGEQRSMMSSSSNLKGPIFFIFVGAMCIYSPSAFSVVMMTTFGYSSVLAYDQFPTSTGQSLSQSAIVILQVIQVVGIYSFVRGWVYLARSGGGQGGQGAFGQGIMYIIGGVLSMNIVGTCNVIAATFGITF
jgi:intracellular multiplication protein IcmC